MKFIFEILFLSIAAHGQNLPNLILPAGDTQISSPRIRLADHAETLKCPPATMRPDTDLVIDVETANLYGCEKGKRIYIAAGRGGSGAITSPILTGAGTANVTAEILAGGIASGIATPPAKEPVKDAPKQDEPKTDWRFMATLIVLTAISFMCVGYWIGLSGAETRNQLSGNQLIRRMEVYAEMGLNAKQIMEIEGWSL